jgi:hypothetical protein
MAKLLHDLVTRFVFKEDKSSLDRIQKGFDNIKKNLLGVAATLATSFVAGTFIQSTAKALEESEKLADSLGITVQQLQALDFAASQTGTSLDSMHSAMMSLQNITAQTLRGTGAYGAVLARFGLTLHKSNGRILTTIELLHEVNQRFQSLRRIDQINLTKSLGFSPEMAKMLRESPKHFNALLQKSQQLGQYQERDTKIAVKYEESLSALKMSFFNLRVVISTAVLPVFTKISDAFTFAISKVTKFTQKFPVLTSVLLKVSAIVGTLIASLAALSAVIKTLNVVAAVMTTIFAEFAVFEAIFLAVGVAIAAVVLALQDLWIGFHGGKSVLLPMIKHFGTFISKIKIVHAVLSGIRSVFHAMAKDVKALENVLSSSMGVKGHATTKGAPISSPPSILHTHHILSNAMPLGNLDVKPSENNTKNINLNVGGITVNAKTDATPNAISDMIHRSLDDRLRASVDHFDSQIAK